jgi:hypothetical protein
MPSGLAMGLTTVSAAGATDPSSFSWVKELDASVDEVLVNVVCKPPANYESGH